MKGPKTFSLSTQSCFLLGVCFLLIIGSLWTILVGISLFDNTDPNRRSIEPTRTSCKAKPIFLDSKGKHVVKLGERPYNPLDLKVGVMTLFDQNWDASAIEAALVNKEQYCNRHGYDMLVPNDLIDPNYATAWSKFIAMKHYLKDYDVIAFFDTDAIIMNFEVEIVRDIVFKVPIARQIITASDSSGLNSGSWIVVNNARIFERHYSMDPANFEFNLEEFFDDAFEIGTSLFSEQPAFYDVALGWLQRTIFRSEYVVNRFPFEYEQRVFHYFLNTPKWASRHLEPHPKFNYYRRQIVTTNQCAMNSYILPPEFCDGKEGNKKNTCKNRQYLDGDFIVHFAGKKGDEKINLMKDYCEISRQKNLY